MVGADFHVLGAEQREGVVVDEDVVQHAGGAAGVEHQAAAVVVDEVVEEADLGAGFRFQRRAAAVQQEAVAHQGPAADAEAALAGRKQPQAVHARRTAQHGAVALAGGDLAAANHVGLARQAEAVARSGGDRAVADLDAPAFDVQPGRRFPGVRDVGLEGQSLENDVGGAGQSQAAADHRPRPARAADHDGPGRLAAEVGQRQVFDQRAAAIVHLDDRAGGQPLGRRGLQCRRRPGSVAGGGRTWSGGSSQPAPRLMQRSRATGPR